MKEDKRAKEEEIYSLLKENEKQQSAVQMLTNELDLIKRSDKQLQQRLEDQKKELEQGYKETIQSMELQLQGSYEKLEVARLNAANEMSSLRLKDTQYQTFLSNQLLECRVYLSFCLDSQLLI